VVRGTGPIRRRSRSRRTRPSLSRQTAQTTGGGKIARKSGADEIFTEARRTQREPTEKEPCPSDDDTKRKSESTSAATTTARGKKHWERLSVFGVRGSVTNVRGAEKTAPMPER